MSATRPPTTAPPATAAPAAAVPPVVLPAEKTLTHAAKFCVQQDKPLLFDYYADSISKKAFVGQNIKTSEKNLIKNAEEFTSPIREMYKVGEDLIVITENSVYVVSAKIEKKATE